MILGFNFDLERQGVAFTTSNVRLVHISFCFFTVRRDLHTALEQSRNRSGKGGRQFQKFAGIGAADPRHRASAAQVRRPSQSMAFEQATLLYIASTEVIAVKVRAFDAGRSFHAFYYRPSE